MRYGCCIVTSKDPNLSITAAPEHEGMRADRFVSESAGITRSRVQVLMTRSLVLSNGSPLKPSGKIHTGDEITLSIPHDPETVLLPEDIPVDVLYHDEHLVVVNKPAGLVVYPAAGHDNGTLMNALKHRFGELAEVGGPVRPGVVHRLDKDTSGAMVVALNDPAYYSLVDQFRLKTTGRVYEALVNGTMTEDEGVISAPIGRSISDRKKMSTRTRHGKDAVTRWRVLMRFSGASLVEARLDTGRTHQIRVHFSSIGHSVLGDRVYGRKISIAYKGRRVAFPRQMLHAKALAFDHPATGERMEFKAPRPDDMEQAMVELGGL